MTVAAASDLLAAWPVEIRDHVSASSLSMWMRCPEQWRYRYVEDRKERPGSDLVWGRAHHGAIEANYKQKMTSLRDLSIGEVKDRFAFLLDEEIERIGGPAEIDWKVKEGEAVTPAEMRDRGVALVGAYQAYMAPRVQPLAVEREFRVPVDAPVPLFGRIDLEAQVTEPFRTLDAWKEADHCRFCDRFIGLEGPLIVQRGICAFCAGDQLIDNKTAAQDKLQPDSKIQGWIYQLERPLAVQFHLAVKTKVPKVTVHEVELAPRRRTLALVQGMMREIAYYLSVYGPAGPWPTKALRDTWACGYCGFRPWCRWHQVDEWEEAMF